MNSKFETERAQQQMCAKAADYGGGTTPQSPSRPVTVIKIVSFQVWSDLAGTMGGDGTMIGITGRAGSTAELELCQTMAMRSCSSCPPNALQLCCCNNVVLRFEIRY